MEDSQGEGRREFLKSWVGVGVALGAVDALALAEAHAQPAAKSVVVGATDPLLRGSGTAVDPTRMAALLDRAMQSFAGATGGADPWRQLVHPGQVVGLKVNTIAGRGLSTNVILVQAIIAKLQQAGIKANDIVVWDRTNHELERAGFHVSSSPGADQVRCMGTDGVGYEDTEESFGVATCRLSKILTRVCDVVINVPLLKDHGEAGVTLAMKNMYGVIDNPNHCHANGCNPAVADVNMLPTIRKKVQFIVADLSTVGYEGGPGFRPQYAWQYNGLLVAKDPVAIDTVGWQIIERKRAEQGLATLAAAGRPPRYIATAADAQHRLGTNDPNFISVVEAA
jgi:uncharacterized protein (DUF362 family)